MDRARQYWQKVTGLPVISLLLGVISLFIYCLADIEQVQYDRQAIAAGQIWRVFTCHFSHWSFDHFLWCTLVIIVMGGMAERLCRKGFVGTIVFSAPVIALVVWWQLPVMVLYRGLSGVGSAVFIFVAVWLLRLRFYRGEWFGAFLAGGAVFLFSVKVLYEFSAKSTLFVSSVQLFTPVPLAHLVGGLVGLLMVQLFWSPEKK